MKYLHWFRWVKLESYSSKPKLLIKYDYKVNWISQGSSWLSSYFSGGLIRINFENEHYAEDGFRIALALLPKIVSLNYCVTLFLEPFQIEY